MSEEKKLKRFLSTIPSERFSLTLPLPLYEQVSLGDARTLNGREFSLYAGLSQDLVVKLKKRSLDESDEAIQKGTSDRQRFGEGSYEEWYQSKERTLFALVDKKTNDLAALVWFGPKPLGMKSLKHLSGAQKKEDERLLDSDGWHTIVYRSYPPYRGIGFMKEFVIFCIETYLQKFPDAKIWAGVFDENPASVAFAQKLGFVESPEHSTQKETILIRT